MNRTRRPTLLALTAVLLFVATLATAADDAGATRVARWKDDKACAFILMFDDSIPSHVKHVVPELTKRGFIGTFYINPGAGHYAKDRQAWEQEIPGAGFELANHTLTHQYATERDAASVTVDLQGAGKIRLTLACSAEAKFYDQPLTLVTTLPAGWTTCHIDQGQRHADARVSAGSVRYDALPGDEPIMITRK